MNTDLIAHLNRTDPYIETWSVKNLQQGQKGPRRLTKKAIFDSVFESKGGIRPDFVVADFSDVDRALRARVLEEVKRRGFDFCELDDGKVAICLWWGALFA